MSSKGYLNSLGTITSYSGVNPPSSGIPCSGKNLFLCKTIIPYENFESGNPSGTASSFLDVFLHGVCCHDPHPCEQPKEHVLKISSVCFHDSGVEEQYSFEAWCGCLSKTQQTFVWNTYGSTGDGGNTTGNSSINDCQYLGFFDIKNVVSDEFVCRIPLTICPDGQTPGVTL